VVVVVALLAVAVLVAALATHAQPPARVARIGILSGASPATSARLHDGFRQALRERGWVEGQNLVVESRWAEGQPERLPDLAAGLVELKVDVIVAATPTAAVAARKATTTIPIVLVGVADPVKLGLAASLARPGKNVTGLAAVGDQLWSTQLALLKEAAPTVSRVAVLWNPSNPGHKTALKEIESAARPLALQPRPYKVGGYEELDEAFTAMTRNRASALLVLPDSLFYVHRARLGDFALKTRLPTMHGLREQVEAGGLLAYAADPADLYRRGAAYVDRILKGAAPGELPIERPTAFDLVINLRTARALALTIPASLSQRATEVIR
jgi:putative ABC transport system substrate-binding protein